MILILRISSMLALTLGCVLLAAAAVRWWDDGSGVAWSRDLPTVAARLAQGGERPGGSLPALSPLVAQAQVFADHLNPPRHVDDAPASRAATDSAPTPAPAASPVRLKLRATSCYPDHPDRSMALVSVAGGDAPREQRWVKEGAQVGPFHIHEIRRGGITYRDGDVLCEVAIERGVERPSLVRDTRIATRQVSAAIDGLLRPLSGVTGPNDIESTGD